MPIFNLPSGKTATFPDNTPPQEMQDALDEIYARDSMNPMARGLYGVAKQLMGAATPEPELKLPVIKGNSFGMTTESGEAVRNTLHQTNEASFEAKLQERAAREKALEAEKDRAQEIQAQQLRMKNESALKQMEIDAAMERAKYSAEVDASKPIPTPLGLYDPTTKQIIEGTAPPPRVPRPISVAPGGVLVDPETGRQMFSNPALPKEPKAPRYRFTEQEELRDGKRVKVSYRINEDTGDISELVLGEVPPSGNPDADARAKEDQELQRLRAEEQSLLNEIDLRFPNRDVDVDPDNPESVAKYNSLIEQFTDVQNRLKQVTQGVQAMPAAPAADNTFTGADGGTYRDNGDGTATRIR